MCSFLFQISARWFTSFSYYRTWFSCWYCTVWVSIMHNIFLLDKGLSWSWSYYSWICNYLCNQCLSPLTLWVWTPFMARCTQYNIMWYSLSVTCDRFSLCIPVSSTNKTDRHTVAEILLKVTLNTINLSLSKITLHNKLKKKNSVFITVLYFPDTFVSSMLCIIHTLTWVWNGL